VAIKLLESDNVAMQKEHASKVKSLQQKITELETQYQKEIMAQIERDNLLKKKVSCSVCGKDISKDQTVLHLQSTNCFHSSHDTCLRQDMLK
jgi:hypothetical protein